MTKPRERVLLVENDPDIGDLIARQTLQPLGYRVRVVESANLAIQEVLSFSPDVILVNLKLPGLSGKDLLVALSSQAIDTPIIVIAERGLEGDVIQAFRLGATDYLSSPVREAEVVSAVERALRQVRAKWERETLARQLSQSNQELQQRVRELTTIFALGKAVTSITNQRALLDKIVEGAVYVTEADSGWLLLREKQGNVYILSACRNLPKVMSDKINQPWDDGISSLVALSGESLSIHGEPLKRFKVSRLGQAALVVPIKAKKEVIGLLVVVRKTSNPFGASNQTLLEAVADYASISLVNALLFNALEDRARSLQQAADRALIGERIKDDILHKINRELQPPLREVKNNLSNLAGKAVNLAEDQRNNLRSSQDHLNLLLESFDSLATLQNTEASRQNSPTFELNEMARQAMARFQRFAHHSGVGLLAELASRPVTVQGNYSQINQVFESLLSNAIKYNIPGGQVVLRIESLREGNSKVAQVMFKDTGCGVDPKHLPKIFNKGFRTGNKDPMRFGGIGISLSLVKEIIETHGGKIFAESELKNGSTFRFTLPLHN